MRTFTKMIDGKIFRAAVLGLGAGAGILAIFTMGVVVGRHKAMFACKWNENYRAAFGDRFGSFSATSAPPGFERGLVGVHGIYGHVVSVSDGNIVVQGRDGIERSVLVDDRTTFRLGADAVTSTNLNAGETVMTFGDPDDDGAIRARFIRILR